MANEQNNVARFPGGAFSPLERQLAQLGSLCEIVPLDLRVEQSTNPYQDDPWACNETLTQSSLGAILAHKKEQKRSAGSAQSKGQTFWAAGTGYGHDSGPCVHGGGGAGTWDPQAMRAVQAAQDEELQQLIRQISESLHTGTISSSCQDNGKALSELLSKSCLTPFLTRELSTSYTNMGDRLPFFKEVYRTVQELMRAIPEHAGVILGHVWPHLENTKASAKTFLQSLGSSAGRVDLADDVTFAHLVVHTSEEVERLCAAKGLRLPAPSSVVPGISDSSASSTSMACALEEEYCRRLRPYQLDQCELMGPHAYVVEGAGETVAPQARTVRLAKELAGLASLLPISCSSSVFVRADTQRQQLWRVIITGPDDTPYSGGCFVFDCYFPQQYPMEPPRIKLLTTGNNMVTFNPNLYESGKVCLSLLGTWKGDKGESWDAHTSRMLQVLVSIQSLILVPEPYFNEPGYEREIGTKQGERRSLEYSMPVRENCIRWAMIENLQNPPHEFREVIMEHFRLRGRKIQDGHRVGGRC